MNTATFTSLLRTSNKRLYQLRMKCMMDEFGTFNACNRFDVGNVHERFVADVIETLGHSVSVHSHAKRIDIIVDEALEYSIKYSSTGDIKLHNSLGTNKDMRMKPTILVTMDEWWVLDELEMQKVDVDVTNYLVSKGDGLALKRSILTALRKAGYPHIIDVDLQIDRKSCLHRSCSDLLYEYITKKVPGEDGAPSGSPL